MVDGEHGPANDEAEEAQSYEELLEKAKRGVGG